jgi:ligand-binding sensor domain-containing protein
MERCGPVSACKDDPAVRRRAARVLAALVVTGACLAGTPAAALDSRRPFADYAIDLWREGDGLPHNFLYTILQTRDGYLWLGTRRGLARFDGVRFSTYDDRRGQLLDPEVRALAEGSDGSLWIGTHGGGISRLRNGAFTTYTTSQGLPADTISALASGPDGAIWIGSPGGLTVFQGEKFQTYTNEHGLPSNNVLALHRDSQGVLWIGTGRGLASYTEAGIVSHAASYPELRGAIRVLAGEGATGIWLDASPADAAAGDRSGGLLRFKGGRVTEFTTRDGLTANEVTALLPDTHGVLWIGTTKGLCRYRDGRIDSLDGEVPEALRATGTFHPRAVNSMYLDREGSLWAGMRFDGLARLRDTIVSTVGGGGASSVFEDRSGTVWVSGSGGLVAWRGRTPVTYTLPGGVSPSVLTEDDEGHLWMGTNSGVLRLRDGRFEAVAAESLHGVAITVLFNDGLGAVWIGTRSAGLYRWSQDRLTHYTTREGLGGMQVRALARDTRRRLWIGTKDGGLSCLEGGHFRTIGPADGLPSVSVTALLVDGEDVVWVATRRGLVRIRGTERVTITAEQGLPANYLYQIVGDGASLWATFAGGVARLDRRELHAVAEGRAARLKPTAYGVENGLRNTAMTLAFQPSAVRASDGRLWFATGHGAAVLDPGRSVRNDVVPPVHIEGVRADGRSLGHADTIVVAPGRGDLQVDYTAPSFLDPSRVEFRYRLEGFDREWVEAGARRAAYYTNLPPGRYRFHVVASNNDGLWNEAGAAVAVSIRPHFYQTYSFYGACVLAVALAGGATQRLRVRRLERQARELSARVQEAVAQMKVLRGLLPICAWCKKIRDDGGYWKQMEQYIHEHSEADFSHGVCPDCGHNVREEARKSGPS